MLAFPPGKDKSRGGRCKETGERKNKGKTYKIVTMLESLDKVILVTLNLETVHSLPRKFTDLLMSLLSRGAMFRHHLHDDSFLE
jgi:hypothetical protein